jgi:hypothetical protein
MANPDEAELAEERILLTPEQTPGELDQSESRSESVIEDFFVSKIRERITKLFPGIENIDLKDEKYKVFVTALKWLNEGIDEGVIFDYVCSSFQKRLAESSGNHKPKNHVEERELYKYLCLELFDSLERKIASLMLSGTGNGDYLTELSKYEEQQKNFLGLIDNFDLLPAEFVWHLLGLSLSFSNYHKDHRLLKFLNNLEEFLRKIILQYHISPDSIISLKIISAGQLQPQIKFSLMDRFGSVIPLIESISKISPDFTSSEDGSKQIIIAGVEDFRMFFI